jgi:hypothetical protein
MRLGEGAPDPTPLVQAARRRGVPLTVYSSDDPTLHQLYESKLVLVRPDGHAAWRGDTITVDPVTLMACLCGEPPSKERNAAAAAQAAVNARWINHSEGIKPMPLKISESWVSLLGSARADGVACLVATADASGNPLISPKGSVLVFDDQTLAYWERSMRGANANLGQNPNVLVYYRNPNPAKAQQLPRGAALRFHGRAEIVESGPIRDEVMARVVQPELDADPERKGVAVLVHVDKITDLGGNVLQQRTT